MFISYQWGKQPEIKALYRALSTRGYSCWLDILQMGGGDSLYDKIDRGVRGCDVMLSCVTTKYSLSANCRREVALADALRKPIIPLLLESMRWPPDGPMSLVLTPLLYIDFSASDAAAATSRDWKSAKFDELISKIDTHLQPSVTSVPGATDDVTRTENNASGATKSESKAIPSNNNNDESPQNEKSPQANKSPRKTTPQEPVKKSASCDIL